MRHYRLKSILSTEFKESEKSAAEGLGHILSERYGFFVTQRNWSSCLVYQRIGIYET